MSKQCIYEKNMSPEKTIFNNAFFKSKADLLELPEITRNIGELKEIEISSSTFPELDTANWYLQELKTKCTKFNIHKLIITIDDCGSIAELDNAIRNKNVQSHFT